MTEEHRARVRALFDEAVEMPIEKRQAFLDAACKGDADLRAEVEGLLAFDHDSLEGTEVVFLKSPLVRPTDISTITIRPPTPQRIGSYRILRLLGEGGMGAVYEAEQDSPRRTVALKVVRPGLASPALLQRFRHESQILGRLHHPGIAQVFEAGIDNDGQPFFAMEFIRGLPLDEYARLRAPTLSSRLELLARVCDAVQHAHEKGVIHRDLKSANILVEETGQPKVLDFGVAYVTAADLLTAAGLTQTGQVLGTPSHMSPEQLTADSAAIDHRADVYALGVILFELAAHRLPYQLENCPVVEVTRLILEEEPPRLGTINPDLRGDVETIVAKALEKDRTRRYSSAANLAADLRRWLNHEPILARPPSALYYLCKFARRNKALVGGAAATGVALVLGLIGTILFAVAEFRQRGQAERNASVAEENAQAANYEKHEAQFQAYRASIAAASAALRNDDVADVARHLKLAPEDLRGWEWRHLHNRLDDSTSSISLSQGSGFLIPGPDRLLFGVSTSAGLRISDLAGGERMTVPVSSKGWHHACIAQTSQGLRIVASVGARAIDVLDERGQVVRRVRLTGDGGEVVISPDGTRLALAVNVGKGQAPIAVLDINSDKQPVLFKGHEKAIWSYNFSPDSSRLVSGSEDRTARVWDATDGKLLAECSGHTSKVLSASFSPDGLRVVTASADGTVRQWNANTGKEVDSPYERHSGEVLTASYSPNGETIASAGTDRTIRVWRAKGRQDVAILHGHTGTVKKVAFSPDGRRLGSLSQNSDIASGTADNTFRAWEVDLQTTLPVLRGHTNYVFPVAYSPDGRWLASGSWDKTVRLWDAATGEPCATLPELNLVHDLAFGPDGTWLATACPNGDRLRIWDVATTRVRQEIKAPGSDFIFVTASPDGTRVAATNSNSGRMNVFDIASGDLLLATEGAALAYSPDGRWLAARAGDRKTVLLLDARTHEIAARFIGHEKTVLKAVFTRDSRFLASCAEEDTVRVWEIGSSDCRVLTGHTDLVFAVAFHPDGTRLASAGRDGLVWLWDLARRDEVVRLPGHNSYVWSLAFSPDGATLASASGDFTVRVWDTAPLKTRYDARREAAALRPKAERLVERLWREKKDWDEVVKAIRADRTMSDAQRHAAVRAVQRQVQQQ